LISLLKKNLDNCKQVLKGVGHSFEYVIHEEDFVLAASSGLDGQYTFEDAMFDIQFNGVVMNPPYFKVRKDSTHARLMDKIVHGQPNIYAFFMALAARLLKENGEIVAITPRSFCNGLYFRSFRKWYFNRVVLDHIHIFESRTDAFKHSSVLQESIITKVHKSSCKSPRIAVTKSFGGDLDKARERTVVALKDIVDNSRGDYIIRIPETSNDREIINLVESFSTRFTDLGLCISTGPVVLFRTKEFLLYDNSDKPSVPLLQPHNIKPFETTWPISKNGKPIAFKLCNDSIRLLLSVKNFVLLKRFSAKEERRRLTAGCFVQYQLPFSHIGIENHLNYIYHIERDLSEDEIFGIAALFNSSLFDRYFRTISGNTQVNATEIRTMYFPDLMTLRKIGSHVKYKKHEIETIIFNHLGVGASVRECLVGN
jgi:adenine-specific DNA-methyltransferase